MHWCRLFVSILLSNDTSICKTGQVITISRVMPPYWIFRQYGVILGELTPEEVGIVNMRRTIDAFVT